MNITLAPQYGTNRPLTPLEKFRHDSYWLSFYNILTDDYRTESVRQALRWSKAPRTRFRISGKLEELLKAKGGRK